MVEKVVFSKQKWGNKSNQGEKPMNYLIRNGCQRIVQIEDIREETATIKTFFFRDKLCRLAKPGQFVMVWIPEVDEVPMSLSFMNDFGLSGVTVERVGEATEALHGKAIGDIIGIRGPFGNFFRPVNEKVALIGGGTGLAPLLPLIEVLKESGATITFVLGFKTSREMFFLGRVQGLLADKKHRILMTTEDGSHGQKGLATDILESLLRGERFHTIYTCGPEPMMRKVFDIAEERNIHVQVCFERIIRCSVGLCGSCVIGKFRVCKEGLVLSSEELREVLDEFGRFKRDFDGRRSKL